MKETINNSEQSVLSRLRELEVGKSVSFPMSRMSYVKSACTAFGLEWDKVFKTRSVRESREIIVTRMA